MPYYQGGSIYWVGSSFPELPEEVRVDEFSECPLDALRRAQDERKGVVLYGNPGTGKTCILGHSRRQRMDSRLPSTTTSRYWWIDRPVLWTTAPEYVQDVQAEIAFSKRYEDWSDAFSASGLARRVPELIIDDLGAERKTEYSIEVIESLIDARYRKRSELITHITSNLALDEMVVRYSERTVSRLAEMCVICEVKGPDRRLAGITNES